MPMPERQGRTGKSSTTERLTMKSNLLLALAAVATLAAGAARADEADGSQYAHRFDSSLSRSEVAAEAGRVSATRGTEPAGSRVIAPMRSTIETKALRADTVLAVRRGHISFGEAGRG
jgi:hypothetical protein